MVNAPQQAVLRGEAAEPPADWPATLNAALLHAVDGGRTVTTIDAHGHELVLTYGELVRAASHVRSALRAVGARPGEPVVLAVRDNTRFLTAFWACVLEGVVPTPFAPPTAGRSEEADRRRLAGVCELFGGPLVIVDEDWAGQDAAIRRLDLRSLPPSGGQATEPHPGEAVPRCPDDVAVHLLTSGSTGVAKCVPLTHRALAHRAWAAARHNGFRADEVALNWMPLDHVGGLVMWCLQSAFLGCHYVDVDTRLVLGDPLAWLDLLSAHRVTMTWAPNFAYGLVNGELRQGTGRRWDLRALRHVLNGGEAVVGSTAQEFAVLLADHGLPATAVQPSWGMSETGSGVVYSCLDATDTAVGMVHVDTASLDGELAFVRPERTSSLPLTVTGVPLPGVTVRVTGEDGEVLPCDWVGELEISGSTLFRGYVGDEEANHRAFTADGWFRTGDRAFVHEGELTIVGRGTDAIIVNGVNVPVHDIEAALESVPDLRPGFVAVCGVHTRSGRCGTVVFAAGTPGSTATSEELGAAVREVTGREFGFAPDDVVVIPAESFPKTAIGKIQRKRLAEEYARSEDPASWMCTEIWDPTTAPPAEGTAPGGLEGTGPGALLLFGDAEDARIAPPGSVVVTRGPAFRELTPLRYEIDPDDAACHAAVHAALDRHGLRPRSAVYTWLPGPETTPPGTPRPEVLDGGGPASLLVALQSAQRAPAPPERLLIATRHACAVRADEPVNPLAATVTGLVRTVRTEGMRLDVRQVDFGTAETPAAVLDALRREARSAAGEAVTAYRDGIRYVPRKVPVKAPAPADRGAPSALRTGATALITGGLGDVGYELARHLQDHYGMNLVLVGRTPARVGGTGERARRLTALAERGRVHYVCCDAGDEVALDRGVAAAEARWGGTVGLVLHLASQDVGGNWLEPERHVVANEPVDTFRSVLRNTFLTAWAAARLAARRPSCTLVLFSSLNGAFGASPFGSYAAACTGVDAFARGPRRPGSGAAHALAWSVWSGLGMSRKAAELDVAVRRRGFRTMNRDEAVDLFESALGADEPYMLLGYVPGQNAEPQDADRHAPRSALATAGDGRPLTTWQDTVVRVWSQVLERRDVGVDDNFFSLGGTSVMVIRAAALLSDGCGARVRVADIYENPTARALATVAERAADGPVPS
ncbi:SDR family NAD(P)-dependent oxidoreductase [Streptomyces sp. NPDC021096]|uniref:SDR family NAD(P)-dependent oxidoreductase n=1 Tax=Streptomyces sp. NPDC021096 TaxID=3154792 RepID=UPI0033C13738